MVFTSQPDSCDLKDAMDNLGQMKGEGSNINVYHIPALDHLPAQPTKEKGIKRALETYDDSQPLVHISYKSLSRESKKKLQELLLQWSEWHAQKCSQESKEVLECGEETYFPALHVGPDNSCSVSFFMENPVWKKQRMENISFNSDSVPLYDRDYAVALTTCDGLINKERGLEILNASRCFNCGSYGHSLKRCPKPHNSIAVSNARKEHQSKRNLITGHRVLTRYYENSPRGKYDGLKPGSLDAVTRKVLGLGELDPPPWLNRMREMGYPAGYIDLEEDQPSGITVYDNGDAKEEKEEINKLHVLEPRKKMSIDIPGINAPIPENANQGSWAAPHQPTCFNPPIDQSNYRSQCFPKLNSERDYYHLEGLPGYTSLSNTLLSNYARSSYRDLMPTYINQPYSSYSPYSTRSSWPSSRG